MNATGNETLDRIQQEIKESLEREEELRRKYQKLNNNVPEVHTNGYGTHHSESPEPPKYPSVPPVMNGIAEAKKVKPVPLVNGSRRFAPNPSARGVMQKFLKMRGKLNLVSIKPTVNQTQTVWTHEESSFDPAKVTIEPGKCTRNGFVPAEEKMRRELQEFQKREEELRKERRKSQPDLMAALGEENESNLKPARSTALLYSTEDLTEEYYSAPPSLKAARSLAELCDASDDDLDTPGTHSLIRQFESLKNQAQS